MGEVESSIKFTGLPIDVAPFVPLPLISNNKLTGLSIDVAHVPPPPFRATS